MHFQPAIWNIYLAITEGNISDDLLIYLLILMNDQDTFVFTDG